MSISFNQIPNNTRIPFFFAEFDNSNAVQGAQAQAYKALIIGQRLSTGTIAAATPVQVTSPAQAALYFGAGSMLADMIAAFLANNTSTELWAIAADDAGGGAQAAGSFKMVGTATAAGTLAFYIGGKLYALAVASGDTPATMATNLAALITADTSAVVTAVVNGSDTAKVDVTYKHKGLVGNYLDLRINYDPSDALPAGVTGVTVVQPSGGTTNPTLTSLIAAMGAVSYNILAFPYTDATSLTAIETELATRWGPSQQLDGVAFGASNVSQSAAATLGNSRNSPYFSIASTYGSPTPIWQYAAMIAANAAFYGAIDPARPFQTLPLIGALAPLVKDRLTNDERNLLLYDGIATLTVDAGGVVRIERLITTYKTNALGAADPSYLDVTTLLTNSYLRWDFRNYWLRKYPRHKLANDGTRYGAGQKIVTPSLGKAEAITKFREWEELGLVEDFASFKAGLIVERNKSNPNRLDFFMPPNLVNQMITGAAQIGFIV